MSRRRTSLAHGGPLSKYLRPAEYSLTKLIFDVKFALRWRIDQPLDQPLAKRLLRLLDALEQSPEAIGSLVNPVRRRGDRTDGKPLAIAVEYLLRIELLKDDEAKRPERSIRVEAKRAVCVSWSKEPKYVERVLR